MKPQESAAVEELTGRAAITADAVSLAAVLGDVEVVAAANGAAAAVVAPGSSASDAGEELVRKLNALFLGKIEQPGLYGT